MADLEPKDPEGAPDGTDSVAAYIDAQKAEIAARDKTIAEQAKAIADRDAVIKALMDGQAENTRRTEQPSRFQKLLRI